MTRIEQDILNELERNQSIELNEIAHIDLEKGLYIGMGVNLENSHGQSEPIYISWRTLKSHFMIFGTTQQGKSRLLAFIMRQLIMKGDDLVLIEPKGDEGHTMYSWLVQYAFEYNRIDNILYMSPADPELSTPINNLHGLTDEQLINTALSAMSVVDDFYRDIANEVLLGVIPALSFLEKTIDPMIIEIMRRIEYSKVYFENKINWLNRRILGNEFDPKLHQIKIDIIHELLKEYGDTKTNRERIESCYQEVMIRYDDPYKVFPIRTFVTLEDLSFYSTQEHIEILLKMVIEQKKVLTKNGYSSELLKECRHVEHELMKVISRDGGFYSKVTSSYSVTLSKLCNGQIGKLLNSSKVNIIRDRLFLQERGLILIVQPFPMSFGVASNMIVKMLLAVFNAAISEVGISGISNPRRLHIMVDEAGSVVNNMIIDQANKGGGLGVSLYLFTQSFEDYVDALQESKAGILADNANTKGFFNMNDDKSAEKASAMLGGRKRGESSHTGSADRTARSQARIADENFVPASKINKLPPQYFAIKISDMVYMVKAPFQVDPYIEVVPKQSSVRRDAQENFIYGTSRNATEFI